MYWAIAIPNFLGYNSLTNTGRDDMTVITISKNHQGWQASFNGGSMPQGIPLPLPFTNAAPAETVKSDLRSRFPGAAFVVKANSR